MTQNLGAASVRLSGRWLPAGETEVTLAHPPHTHSGETPTVSILTSVFILQTVVTDLHLQQGDERREHRPRRLAGAQWMPLLPSPHSSPGTLPSQT